MSLSIFSASLTIAHAIILTAILVWASEAMRGDRALQICAVFVLGWTDLVGTALLLASAGWLGDRFAYVGLSLILALALALVLRRPLKAVGGAPRDWSEGSGEGRASRGSLLGRFLLWFSIIAVVLPTAMLCFAYDPDNFDSVAYRLPRAFLYIGQGNLRHLPGGDFRMQFYPFDMTLAYVAIAIHGLAGHWLNLFAFVVWLVGGVAVERTARAYGAGRTAALFAATIYLTTPAVLISASSGNDDMMAGVPLLIGLLFATRWWRSGNSAEASLAAMGIGLSAGSKLHYPFLAPVLGLLGAALLYRLVAYGKLGVFLRARWLQIAATSCIIAVLALPALVINVVETGRATPDLPNYVNKPFSLIAAGTTSIVSSASLFLAPIPDLDLDPDAAERQALYSGFNDWLNKHLFSWVTPALNYSNEPYYRFEGVASNDAYQGVWEQSAWVGFMPWLLLLVPAVAWSRRIGRGTPEADGLRVAALWFTAAFFSWHLARCFLLKYVGAAGIYYAYPAIFGAPAVAWLWDAARDNSIALRLALRASCIGVLSASLISAANTFAYNQQRNIPELLQAEHYRPRQGIIGPKLAAALKASRRSLIAYTQWELPLMDLISVQPEARYALTGTFAAAPVPGYDLSFMIQRAVSHYGDIPFQFAKDDRPRLAMLGTMDSGWGKQNAFGHAAVSAMPRSAVVAADYRADIDEGDLNLTSGWFASEHTQRWSSGRSSEIDFELSGVEARCRFDLKAISAGPQRVTTKLNGRAAGSFALDAWLPGENRHLSLPDSAILPGLNRLILSFDRAHADEDPRVLAIGLVEAALRCERSPKERTAQSANGSGSRRRFASTPLTQRGFAILGIDEQRDARGGLTGVQLTRISGADADESFEVAMSTRSPAGVRSSVVTLRKIPWSQWIAVPEAPRDGFLEFTLCRVDRPDIVAHVEIPVDAESFLGLDLRSDDIAPEVLPPDSSQNNRP